MAAAVALIVLLAGCGGDDPVETGGSSNGDVPASGADARVDPNATPSDRNPAPVENAPAPAVNPDKPTPTLPDGDVRELIIEDRVLGDGEEARPGMLVEVHYVGVNACGGAEFDASWNRGSTFEFLLGGRQVIYGWDAGVEGMRVGGQRQLTIPSHMAYGATGSGSGSIGPNADLVFVVDLISVETTDTEVEPLVAPAQPSPPPEVAGKPIPTLPEGPVTELIIEDLTVGDGDVAANGMLAEVHYVGVLACNGQQFDASWDSGNTFSFPIGAQRVIPGWDKGVLDMQVGGRRQLTIPAAEAYGRSGSGPIPGNADLVFVIDLVSLTEPVSADEQPEIRVPDPLPAQLVTNDLVVGDGAVVAENQTVTAHFAAAPASTGEVVQSTWTTTGLPTTLSTGPDGLPGLAQGLIGMAEGGTREIIIPPDLAFGEAGSPASGIGPNETLVMVVQVVAING